MIDVSINEIQIVNDPQEQAKLNNEAQATYDDAMSQLHDDASGVVEA